MVDANSSTAEDDVGRASTDQDVVHSSQDGSEVVYGLVRSTL